MNDEIIYPDHIQLKDSLEAILGVIKETDKKYGKNVVIYTSAGTFEGEILQILEEVIVLRKSLGRSLVGAKDEYKHVNTISYIPKHNSWRGLY